MAEEIKGHKKVVATVFDMEESELLPLYILSDGTVLEVKVRILMQGPNYEWVPSTRYTAELEPCCVIGVYGLVAQRTSIVLKKDGEVVLETND